VGKVFLLPTILIREVQFMPVLNMALLLMLFLGVGTSSVQARDCSVVAKIYLTDIINEVSIRRKGTEKPTWASKDNRKLCAGDVVTAPNRSILPLTIRYYTEIRKMTKLKRGETHQVEALSEPCGMWCTAWDDIKRLYYKLTSKVPENVGDGIGGGRGGDSDNSKPSPNITMPLDAGKGFEYPFYLYAREGIIPLFWEEGQPPYQLEVKDAIGYVITHNILKNNTFSIIVPNTEPEQTYTLKISSAGSVSYQKKLIFAMPPFPLDPKIDKLRMLARLLNDPNKNWRLEIWRQLATMPKSQSRENFKAHLRLKDYARRGG
jgi:hypothetical protein